jgi:hypothetical protein
LGALIGHADTETRPTTGLVSGQRFGSLGLIIVGTQLNGKPDYLGPAIVFSLVDLILSVEIGRRATPTRADDPDPHERSIASRLAQDERAAAASATTRAAPSALSSPWMRKQGFDARLPRKQRRR